MNYCSHCGRPVVLKVPPGDNLPRHVCDACQTIHYQNPKIVAGCIPEWEDQVLLCRRAIEPRIGFWTFPAGFMEAGEDTAQAAARETLEEAQASVEIASLSALLSLPHVSQVYLVFRGTLRHLEFGAGTESLEVQLFPWDQVPWEHLAFPVIHEALARYVEDRRRGEYRLHVGVVDWLMPKGHE